MKTFSAACVMAASCSNGFAADSVDQSIRPLLRDDWNYDALGASVAGNTREIQDRLANFAAHQVHSLSAESGGNWGPHGIGYYLAGKLMWNPMAQGGSGNGHYDG